MSNANVHRLRTLLARSQDARAHAGELVALLRIAPLARRAENVDKSGRAHNFFRASSDPEELIEKDRTSATHFPITPVQGADICRLVADLAIAEQRAVKHAAKGKAGDVR